ncbi:hypothetical protein H5410_062209 [Solanum commersonii]|uniref:Uncharacterized protein n=1 Tax=Solanum commersonii TaxID=4109 RepID=A0A9J5W9S8_SOLCO|nr:hypothetical protein H5410_062209 [Solanum commersonii]
MLEKDFTLSNGEITKSIFPPQQCFQINKNDRIVNFNAFSNLFENDTALVTSHVNAIIKQNNYANIYMSILGEHIVSLHDKMDKIITLLPTKLITPPEIDNFKLKDYSDLENFLEKKFKGSGAQPINAENFLQGESSKNIEFSNEVNKISVRYARKLVQRMYYYPRPTPQDVLLEEHEHIITNSYNGKEIYEWYIDDGLPTLCRKGRHHLKKKTTRRILLEQFDFIPNQKSKDKEYTLRRKKSSKKDYEKWKKKRIEKKLRNLKKKNETLLRKRSIVEIIIDRDTCTNVEDLVTMPRL